MSVEDTISYLDPVESCIVCGKNVTGSGGFARVNHKGTMVNLCCPHCLDTVQQDPAPHTARLAKVLRYRAIRDIAKSPLH
jgi:hypothetical protein